MAMPYGGDPLDLPIDRFDDAYRRAIQVEKWKRGDGGMDAIEEKLERMAQRYGG